MPFVRDDLPYSQKRLEDLAIALGITTSRLWINPVTSALDVRDIPSKHADRVLDQDEDESLD